MLHENELRCLCEMVVKIGQIPCGTGDSTNCPDERPDFWIAKTATTLLILKKFAARTGIPRRSKFLIDNN